METNLPESEDLFKLTNEILNIRRNMKCLFCMKCHEVHVL